MVRRVLHHYGKRFLLHEKSPKKLALATSVALYVAISPFFGLHTIMLILAGWLFNLNIPVLIMVSYAVNNPWTMIPIMAGGYWVGYYLLHIICGLDVAALNPAIMSTINGHIQTYIGIKGVSFWAFLLGGNLVGIAIALVAYPFAYLLFKKLAEEHIV